MGLGKTYSADYLIDSNGNTGVSGQVLISTATGIDWADGSAITGGPFLPLAGGTITGNVRFNDTFKAEFGSGADLQINHDGTDSLINNATGHLTIRNGANDKNIFLQADNGSGGNTSYLTLNGASTHAYFSNPGNVGIGTDSPGAALQIGNGVGDKLLKIHGAATAGIQIFTGGGAGAKIAFLEQHFSNEGALGLKYDGTTKIHLRANGNSYFNGGNVGIGTTAPTATLNVKNSSATALPATSGTTQSASALRVDNGNVVLDFGSYSSNGASWIQSSLVSNLATTFPISLNPNGGNVGIGETSPTSKLSIKGAQAAIDITRGTAGDSKWEFSSDSTALYFSEMSTGTRAYMMTIKETSGNVGIGTASPNAKLDVVGNTRLGSGTLHVSTDQTFPSGFTYSFRDAVGILNPNGTSAAVATAVMSIGGMSNGHSLVTTGNVGIGTTSPQRPLHVNGGALNFVAEFESTDDKASILLQDDDTLNYIHSQDGYLSLGGQNALSGNNLNINSTNGNVGIGTTIPYAYDTTETRLHVKNAGSSGSISEVARLEGASDADGSGAILRIGTSNDRGIYLEGGRTGSVPYASIGTTEYNGAKTEGIRITSTGNVGIGTTALSSYNASARNLVVYSTGNTGITIASNNTSSDGTIRFADGTGGTAGYRGSIQYSHGGDFMNFNTAASERMRIDSSGNVGVGTTSPDAKLHVSASSGVAFKVNPNNAAKEWYIDTTNPDHLKKEGNLNISADPTAAHASTKINFLIDGSNKMRIQDNGNVGISTTSPSYALDVTGTIRATGNVIAYSDARVKENVETIPNALDKVNAMRGVGYNKIGEEERSVGVIAQELLEVLPEAVHQDEHGMYSVAYGNITGVLIEAIKELTKEIKELKKQIK